MVQRLERHAGGHRAVADHGDRLAIAVLQAGGNGHAQRGADRGAGVADAKGVVLALGAAREGGDAVLLAQGAHALAAAGEDLVRIGLMTRRPTPAGRPGCRRRNAARWSARSRPGRHRNARRSGRPCRAIPGATHRPGFPARLRLTGAGRPACSRGRAGAWSGACGESHETSWASGESL